ncbi:TRAP transporter substrate-binding protein [Shouchella lehensis]|uniref:TRAP dicarboxylate transporter DctP subunit n=1 Tax=Shouchella lehensis G1 TaxID=1246626 RepID=A0A060LPW5_9BACI|nr:TRAP transporter substrate-binding protein [Shouchella lehensis]AIC93371.1 TRAP dicarboxylate transporter DctP subunit [Shouchella lehensis G1]
MKRQLLLASCFISLAACSVTGHAEEPKMMRIANTTPEDRSLSQALYHFADRLEEETDGSIHVEVYTNSQIGGDRELFEGMQFNTIQAATMSTGPIAQFAPTFNVLELPFLFENESEAYELLDGPIGEELLLELEAQKVVGINYFENGFRVLTNNVKEIKELEDVKGIDLRTLENQWHMQIWSELGANPTPMNYSELYIGLEQGTIAGQENPIGNVVNSHFYEVQQYLTMTNHIYNASPFMVSKAFWEILTPQERQAIEEVADEVQASQRLANQEEARVSRAYLEEKGITITELTDKERERWIEASNPVRERFGNQEDHHGWVQRIEQALQADSQE